jgi:hypothetical protein
MSGGGTNTVQSNSAPPPQVLNAYVNATNQAQAVSQTPFQTPQAPVAGLTWQQQQGLQEVQNAQGAAQPYINQANNYIQQSNAPLNGAQPYENAASSYAQAASLYNPAAVLGQYTNPASGLYQQSVANGINAPQVSASGIAAGQVSPTQFSAGQVGQYESPYTQDVVNATQAEFNNQNAQQQAGVQGNAISAGAWGGDRSAVAQGITAGQQQLAEAPVIAGLENQGYSQALGEFNQQQQTGLQAQEANVGTNLTAQQANQANYLAAQQSNQGASLQAQEAQAGLQQSAAAGLTGIGGLTAQEQTAEQQGALGISNAYSGIGQQALGAQEAQGWLASQGGFASANLGNEALNSDLTGANALIGAGSLVQQQQQAELNAPYEEQLAAEAYPFQESQFLTNSVEGLGAGQGGTSSTTSPGPSALSQVAGVATTGLGIAALAGLLKRGGAIRRAGGGVIPGAASNVPGLGSGIAGVVNVVPQTTGSSVHGMGPPAPPPAQQQPNQLAGLNQEMLTIGGMQNRNGANAGSSGPGLVQQGIGMGSGYLSAMTEGGPDAMAMEAADNAGAAGIASGAGEGLGLMAAARHGGGIPHRGIGGMMPHIGGVPKIGGAPKMPHMGGLGAVAGGGHMFHPAGLHLAPGGGINLTQPDQTAQEVQADNTGQDEANAMAVAMASSGSGVTPMMNMPSQARGGGIAAYADGGEVDSGSWDDSTPPVTITGSPTTTPGGGAGITGAPPPPAPAGGQQDAVQTSVTPADQSGIAGGSTGSGHKPPSNSEIWGSTLLAAGLGMLGGTSPFAGVNIGRGGLEGLQVGESMKSREENMQLRQTQQEQNNLYRKDMLQQQGLYRQQMADAATKRADTGADRAQTYSMLSQASAAQKMADASYLTARASMGAASHASEGDIRSQAIKSLVGTMNPDTGKPWTTSEAYRYTGGFDIRQQNADTAAQRAATSADQGQQRIGIAQGGLDLRTQAFQTSQSRAQQALVEKATDADLSRAVGLSNASKDINGNIKLNLHDALGQVMKERGNAAPGAGTAPVAGSRPSLSSILGE